MNNFYYIILLLFGLQTFSQNDFLNEIYVEENLENIISIWFYKDGNKTINMDSINNKTIVFDKYFVGSNLFSVIADNENQRLDILSNFNPLFDKFSNNLLKNERPKFIVDLDEHLNLYLNPKFTNVNLIHSSLNISDDNLHLIPIIIEKNLFRGDDRGNFCAWCHNNSHCYFLNIIVANKHEIIYSKTGYICHGISWDDKEIKKKLKYISEVDWAHFFSFFK